MALKKDHKFENLGHSDLVISVRLDPASMHICVKYEGSVINYIGRKGINLARKKTAT